jgi:hypothetical protein
MNTRGAMQARALLAAVGCTAGWRLTSRGRRRAAGRSTCVRAKIISSVASACFPSAFFFACCFQVGVRLPPAPLRRAAAELPQLAPAVDAAAASRLPAAAAASSA